MYYNNINSPKKSLTKYYAIVLGRKTGIFNSWDETKLLVNGYSGAIFKSFRSYNDAVNYFLQHKENTEVKKDIKTKEQKDIKEEYKNAISERKRVIYTDGSFNNGYGGYGIVVVDNEIEVIRYSGHVPEYPTTSNRAELYAILVVVSNYSGDFLIKTDSEYCIDSLTKNIIKWVENKWKKTNGKDVKNRDLISDIIIKSQKRTISFQHVYGHEGDLFNEIADKLANLGRLNYKI